MTCRAEQMSDQMVCVCGNVWDVMGLGAVGGETKID